MGNITLFDDGEFSLVQTREGKHAPVFLLFGGRKFGAVSPDLLMPGWWFGFLGDEESEPLPTRQDAMRWVWSHRRDFPLKELTGAMAEAF